MRHFHVFAVDPTQTPQEAWDEVCRYGHRVTDSRLGEYWALLACDGVECEDIEVDRAARR